MVATAGADDSAVCLVVSASSALLTSGCEESSLPDFVALVAFKGGTVSSLGVSVTVFVSVEGDEVSALAVAMVDSVMIFFGKAVSDSVIISSITLLTAFLFFGSTPSSSFLISSSLRISESTAAILLSSLISTSILLLLLSFSKSFRSASLSTYASAFNVDVSTSASVDVVDDAAVVVLELMVVVLGVVWVVFGLLVVSATGACGVEQLVSLQSGVSRLVVVVVPASVVVVVVVVVVAVSYTHLTLPTRRTV